MLEAKVVQSNVRTEQEIRKTLKHKGDIGTLEFELLKISSHHFLRSFWFLYVYVCMYVCLFAVSFVIIIIVVICPLTSHTKDKLQTIYNCD